MCQVHNTIGSLTAIKSHLQRHGIHDFKSLNEVIEFQNSYESLKSEIINIHKRHIDEEKFHLESDIHQLKESIAAERFRIEESLKNDIIELKKKLEHSLSKAKSNFLYGLFKGLRKWHHQKKIKHLENNFLSIVENEIQALNNIYEEKKLRFQFIDSDAFEAARQSARIDLLELDSKKTITDEIKPFILGALGEQKVVKVLEGLSDHYYLINDFSVSFNPAIYNSQEKDYIKSVQIDHVVIGPSGVFIIETKNWSEKSIANQSLRSPVEQIRRSGFSLYKLLSSEMNRNRITIKNHHWGIKKIPIKNLVVMISAKPEGDYDFVKILSLAELLSYINFFNPIFTKSETQRIADYLLRINNQKTVSVNLNSDSFGYLQKPYNPFRGFR